jgi:histone deacetylase complex regulatory component SIN3
MYDWTARRMADAADNDSKADEMLLKRCAYHGINYSAPFIVMRHWADLHQEGEYWCGEFETDEIDDKLAELIVNIQFACQRHFFGSLAEKYFDDKLRDATTNRCHKQKTIECFNKLSEEFTVDDVMKAFKMTLNTARMRVKRLQKDGAIEKCGEIIENGGKKFVYKKKGALIF